MPVVALQLRVEGQGPEGGLARDAVHFVDGHGGLGLVRRGQDLAQQLVGRVRVPAGVEAAALLALALAVLSLRRRRRVEPPDLSPGRLSREHRLRSVGAGVDLGGLLVRTLVVGEAPSLTQMVLLVCPRSCESL